MCVTIMTNFRSLCLRMMHEDQFDALQLAASHEASLARYSLQDSDIALLQLPELPDNLLD